MRNMRFLRRLLRNVRGGTAIEYGLIVSLIVIAVMAAISGVADETHRIWSIVETESAKAQSGS